MWCMLMHLFEHEQYLDSRGPATVRSESALEILRRRYANGGLSREQYLDMKATLEGGVERFFSLPRQEHS
jgi:uncharacterized membrane protein